MVHQEVYRVAMAQAMAVLVATVKSVAVAE